MRVRRVKRCRASTAGAAREAGEGSGRPCGVRSARAEQVRSGGGGVAEVGAGEAVMAQRERTVVDREEGRAVPRNGGRTTAQVRRWPTLRLPRVDGRRSSVSPEGDGGGRQPLGRSTSRVGEWKGRGPPVRGQRLRVDAEARQRGRAGHRPEGGAFGRERISHIRHEPDSRSGCSGDQSCPRSTRVRRTPGVRAEQRVGAGERASRGSIEGLRQSCRSATGRL
jgi:hypothetical protein